MQAQTTMPKLAQTLEIPAPPSADARLPISESVPATAHESLPLSLFLLAAFTVLAAVVRIVATHNDLWLDEIISLRIANSVATPWQVFSAVHSDNNHYLTTLYLYFVRDTDSVPVYRYLSVLLGVALVPAGYWLLGRRSRVEAVILAGLLACSYPLIHFSSEARGYAGALLGSMLACAALARWMAERNGTSRSFFLGGVYGVGLTLAILSHLTACLIGLALAAGSLMILLERRGRAKQIAYWIALNFLPAAVLASLYFVDLRFLSELGGTPMSVLHGLGRLLAIGLGWPAKDNASVWIVWAPLIGLIAWQLKQERKSGEPLAVLLALIYLVPLICVLLMRPSFFAARYLLVILPFLYVPMAMLLARLVHSSSGRMVLAGILFLFLAGQTYSYARFLQAGRGQFTAALQYMMTHTRSTRIAVSSNQDFRSDMELSYYGPRVMGNRELIYVARGGQAPVQPDWYIVHEEGYEPPGPKAIREPGGPMLYRAEYFGASELSGQAWTIYRREPGR